jgi:adenylate cyclase class 2
MATEVEAKLRVGSLEPVAERLELLGAACEGEQLEIDHYLDDGSSSLTAADSALRVRCRPGDRVGPACITYKGRGGKGRFKEREEIEVAVADGGLALELLARLGYGTRVTVRKTRRTWRTGGCVVALDRVERLGDFVEIEGPDAEAIARVQRRLGLGDAAHIGDSYASMLAADGERS